MDAMTASRGAVRAVTDDADPRRLAPARRARGRLLRARQRRVGRRAAAHGAGGAERIVCVLTGHGLKDPQTALDHAGAVVPCEPRARGRRAGRARRDASPPRRPRPRLLGQPRAGLRRASPPRSALHLELEVDGDGRVRGRDRPARRARPAQPRACAASSGCIRRTASRSGCARTSRSRAGSGSSAAALRRGPARRRPPFGRRRRPPRRCAHRDRGPSRTTSPPRCSAASSSTSTAAPRASSRPPGWRRCSSCRTSAVRTAAARAALPGDGAARATRSPTSAHAALLDARARARRPRPRRAGLGDRLHQPYRAHLFPRSAALLERAAALGALGRDDLGRRPDGARLGAHGGGGGVTEALEREVRGWARVMPAQFEPRGARVLEG